MSLSVLTQGIGSFGSVPLLLTWGLGIGVPPIPPVTSGEVDWYYDIRYVQTIDSDVRYIQRTESRNVEM